MSHPKSKKKNVFRFCENFSCIGKIIVRKTKKANLIFEEELRHWSLKVTKIIYLIHVYLSFFFRSETLTNLELRSRIIASTADPRPTGILQENVTISFHYDKVRPPQSVKLGKMLSLRSMHKSNKEKSQNHISAQVVAREVAVMDSCFVLFETHYIQFAVYVFIFERRARELAKTA